MSQPPQEGAQQMDEDPPQLEQPQPLPRHQALEENELLDSPEPPPIDWQSLLSSIERNVKEIKQEMGKIHKKIDWCLSRKRKSEKLDVKNEKKFKDAHDDTAINMEKNYEKTLRQVRAIVHSAIEEKLGFDYNGPKMESKDKPQERSTSPQPGPSRVQGNPGNQGYQSQPPNACIFCEGNHWATTCKTYSTLSQRRQRLQAKNKCERCLGKATHLATSCAANAPCFYCRKLGRGDITTHHSALCPAQFEF